MKLQPLLRRVGATDLDALVDFLEDSYRTTWAPHVSVEAWRQWTDQQRPRKYVEAMGDEFVVAEVAGSVAAMVHWRDDFVHALHVHSRCRRQGLGSVLLRHAEEEIASAGHDAVRLETDSFNAASRSFYASHGYAQAGSRPDSEWNCGFETLLLVKRLRRRDVAGGAG